MGGAKLRISHRVGKFNKAKGFSLKISLNFSFNTTSPHNNIQLAILQPQGRD